MLSTAAESMQGGLHGADRAFAGLSTDTRTLADGELFFALTGPNFDGRAFLSDAKTKGAAGAVVSSPTERIDLAQIAVDDPRLALGRLGAAWRDAQDPVVIGITGSNGKTTLKELTAACLSVQASTLATQGNYNNDIGMPLMLSRIEPRHHYVVLEMGANHRGEIAYLTSLAKPDVVVITNAAAAHLEGFGSIEGVAHAKGEILEGEPRPRCAVLNADDEYFGYWQSLAQDIDVLSFGLGEAADVRAYDNVVDAGLTRFVLHVGDQDVLVSLPLVGTHNVRNACAAAAVATALGVGAGDIAAALGTTLPVDGRLVPLPGRAGSTVYDDSYNANPLSVNAAGEFLTALPGASWIVLGDMKELGADEKRLHREVGEQLKSVGIDRLFATGDLCRDTVDGFGAGATWYESVDALAADLAKRLSAPVNVLVKGSRAMRMERVVAAICRPADTEAGS